MGILYDSPAFGCTRAKVIYFLRRRRRRRRHRRRGGRRSPSLLFSADSVAKQQIRVEMAESAVMAAEAAAIWLFVVQRNEKKSSVGDFVIITTHTKKMRRTEQRES